MSETVDGETVDPETVDGEADDTETIDDETIDTEAVDSVMVVGTLGGGGIHRYVAEQAAHLDDVLSVRVHDMYADPKGSGVVWAIRSFLLAVVAAARFLQRQPADVVHVHTSQQYSFYRASFYVLVAAYGWRRPVVLHVHGSSFDEFLARDADGLLGALVDAVLARYRAFVLRTPDRVIVLSPSWKRVLSRYVDPSALVVVPNAVDPDEYEPSYDADPPHVVFVSNLVARKGVRELAEALDALAAADHDVRTTIAGTGPLTAVAEAVAARHDAVDYVGYVSEERKRHLLESGTVFVLPAYAEGLPIAMLEGMAGGNAVVATRVGAIPEVIGTSNGRLVDPRDVDALTAALAELVDDPELASTMGRRNHELVRERYAWSVTVPLLCELYDAVIDERGRRAAPTPTA